MSVEATDMPVDLRSDTVTQPTAAMRAAMSNAIVGDDVFREDPTVRALEERVAELTGMDAGLFVPSGTMANLIAILAHVPRGGEVIADEESHLVLNEGGGAAFLGGAMVRTLRSDKHAQFGADALMLAFRDPHNIHHPRSCLLMLENTHAHHMGMPLDMAYVAAVASAAHDRGVAVHVDGARLLNAATALRSTPAALVESVDSASVCLSKGLACPAGSVLVGSATFIDAARRLRKALGGGQRQIGILAAAGLLALEPGPDGMVDRLGEDHARARCLAEGLAGIEGLDVEPELVRTNIVIVGLRDDLQRAMAWRDAMAESLAARGILVMRYPRGRLRAVTHYGISDSDIERTLAAVAEAMGERQA